VRCSPRGLQLKYAAAQPEMHNYAGNDVLNMSRLPKRGFSLAAMLSALPCPPALCASHVSRTRSLAACSASHFPVAQPVPQRNAQHWQEAADAVRRLSSRGCSTRAAAAAAPSADAQQVLHVFGCSACA